MLLLFPGFQNKHLPKISIPKVSPALSPQKIVPPPKVIAPPVVPAQTQTEVQPKPLFSLPPTKPPAAPPTITIQGIIISGGKPVALINNDIHVIGDKIQEMEIIEITTSAVKMRKGEEIKTFPVRK